MILDNWHTPIQKLSEKMNNNAFYVKREDLLPISFGGNKVRKAIIFYEDLKKLGCDCVVTYGSSSSNHCRVIANIAASKGVPCHIISPIESSKRTRNLEILRILGANITQCSITDVSHTIRSKLQQLECEGYKPYFIQGGGHGNNGTKAYVEVYDEIVGYENKAGIHFDYIFHASGTGTTQAGLVCGQLINNDRRRIVGISNARKNHYGAQVVLESANDYLRYIGKELATAKSVSFIDDYILNGYATYNDEMLATIKEVLIHEGIPLDTTYTGKAYWGMKKYIEANQITDKNILFIHTGGTPLFFDDLGELVNE